jgi:hypothetical protein
VSENEWFLNGFAKLLAGDKSKEGMEWLKIESQHVIVILRLQNAESPDFLRNFIGFSCD